MKFKIHMIFLKEGIFSFLGDKYNNVNCCDSISRFILSNSFFCNNSTFRRFTLDRLEIKC